MGNRCLRGQRTISDASQAIFQREEDLFSQKIIAAEMLTSQQTFANGTPDIFGAPVTMTARLTNDNCYHDA